MNTFEQSFDVITTGINRTVLTVYRVRDITDVSMTKMVQKCVNNAVKLLKLAYFR